MDADLKVQFTPIAKQLADNETKIVDELNDIQGKPINIGGYYKANEELMSSAMRPNSTFNSILNQ